MLGQNVHKKMFMARSYNVIIRYRNIERKHSEIIFSECPFYLLNVFILLGTKLRIMLRNTAYMEHSFLQCYLEEHSHNIERKLEQHSRNAFMMLLFFAFYSFEFAVV